MGKPEQKPPLGITPRFIVDELRAIDILNASIRYVLSKKHIPTEWLFELEDINYRLNSNND